MEKDISLPHVTPAEREPENEANRLIEHIDTALALVAVRSHNEIDSIDAAADRIERASHDLVLALRELAQERSSSDET